MADKKDDFLDVMVRSDTKNEENKDELDFDRSADTDDEEIADEDVDGEEVNDMETGDTAENEEKDTSLSSLPAEQPVRQRRVRPAVYGALAVIAVGLAFLVGSLLGRNKSAPEPVPTTEPIVETEETPAPTSTPEPSALPSSDPLIEEDPEEEDSEEDEDKEEDEENDEDLDEEDEEDEDEDKEDKDKDEDEDDESRPSSTATPKPSPTPDPALYNGMAPAIGGGSAVTPGSQGNGGSSGNDNTVQPSNDSAVNNAASRIMSSQTGMSKKELVNSLVSAGYTSEQANRAADNMAVSWTQQAIYRAMSVFDRDTYTRDALIYELMTDGFSQSDATAAADAVGA